MDVETATLFRQALKQTRMAVTIADPHRPDSPIVYANHPFTELTGFPLEEIVGRNCRFLQGPKTDPTAVEEIRNAVGAREVRVVELLNYRRDDSTFWNSLYVGPIYDDSLCEFRAELLDPAINC
ncbi:PAS domain-containing protein [Jannaschia rubra]|uniref:PAS domain-containing protein n=1 Tax=Jannaschia rubra TaxID=282197 RepID=UPI00249081A2|nr:PAS domain-containing protein [Jannaschia rubra]